MKVKKITSKEFKYIYGRVPRLCVEIVIKTNEGVLLTKRNIPPLKGRWHIPGGTVLMGETIKKTIKRIANEELNIKVIPKKLLGVIEYDIKNYFSRPIGLAYLVKTTLSKNLKLNKQANVFGFFKIIPKNTVKEQRIFLNKLNRLK
jgi:ADP-ribose pyrophosphatase YjhB (NUDIX family)